MNGPHLRKVRMSARISQTYMAHKAKVSRYRLSMFELGYLELTNEELEKLKVAYKHELGGKAKELASLGYSLCDSCTKLFGEEGDDHE